MGAELMPTGLFETICTEWYPTSPIRGGATEQTLEDLLEGAMPKKVRKPTGPVFKNNHRYLTGITHARPIMSELSILLEKIGCSSGQERGYKQALKTLSKSVLISSNI